MVKNSRPLRLVLAFSGSVWLVFSMSK